MGDHAARRGEALTAAGRGGETAGADLPDAKLMDEGRRLFARPARFMAGVAGLASLPKPWLPEVAFAGRSNVGKSSLLNALTGRRNLARASQTPGRTRELNFFELEGKLVLVDLPGYGYAKVAKDRSADWNALVRAYLQGRPTLKRLLLLIDARRGIMDSDRDAMELLDRAAASFQIVLTKSDSCRPAELAARAREVAAEAARHAAAHPAALATSAETGLGIERLRAEIAALLAR